MYRLETTSPCTSTMGGAAAADDSSATRVWTVSFPRSRRLWKTPRGGDIGPPPEAHPVPLAVVPASAATVRVLRSGATDDACDEAHRLAPWDRPGWHARSGGSARVAAMAHVVRAHDTVLADGDRGPFSPADRGSVIRRRA